MKEQLFAYKRIAEGYAKDRPFLHPYAMEMLKEELRRKENYKNGLDVGCGAGLSAKALHLVCDRVTGTDASEEMIAAAKILCQESCYRFFTCAAEETPEQEGPFDIVTAAGVINWVEERKFLQRLGRVLEEQGILLIYDFGISDQMKENPSYTDWFNGQYLARFPRPPRKERRWTRQDVEPWGFRILSQRSWTAEWETEIEAFVRFMLLQSNVTAQAEGMGRDPEEAGAWFQKTLAPVFQGRKQTLLFEGYSWLFCKAAYLTGGEG